MKKDDLLSAIGNIDEKYIQEAMDFKPSVELVEPASKLRRRPWWLRYGSIAACLLIGVGLWAGFGDTSQDESSPVKSIIESKEALPMLSVETARESGGGPKLTQVEDIQKLKDDNPWEEEAELDTLPVYENTAFGNYAGVTASVSEDELEQDVNVAAAAVNMDVDDVTFFRDDSGIENGSVEKEAVFEAAAENDEMSITVSSAKDVFVQYHEGLILPEEYQVSEALMTEEKAEEVTAFLLDEFAAGLGFEKPVISVKKCYGDSAEEPYRWRLMAYEDGDNLKEKMLFYSMKRIEFELDKDGNLHRIMVRNDLKGREKIGDYPIISAEKAKELLLAGKISDYVGFPMPGEEYIEKAELVYEAGRLRQTYMPYYVFVVRQPDNGEETVNGENGEKLETYGRYYVPAIEAQYLENFSEEMGKEEPDADTGVLDDGTALAGSTPL